MITGATGVLVEAADLRVSFPTRRGTVIALAGVDLKIRSGEHTAICGHSGSGKSTLISVIAGLGRPGSGSLRVCDQRPYELNRQSAADFRARHLGLMFQSPGLLPNLRLIDNAALPAVLAGESTRTAYQRAAELLRATGLGDRLDAYPGELSGGQQRRGALARALANRPMLLLADEPTNDLDDAAAQAVLDLMLKLADEMGTTLVVVTHDTRIARRLCRVVTLTSGKVTGDETAKAFETPGREVELIDPLPEIGPFGHSTGNQSELVELAPAVGWTGWLALAVGWLCLGAGLVFAFDQGLALWQNRELARQATRKKTAETLAMEALRADILEVTSQADGRHRITVFLENYGREPLHVLGPRLGLHVQAGRNWMTVPIEHEGDFEGRLHAVAGGKSRFAFRFRLPEGPYDELMSGYLHLRITATLVVGTGPESTGDLFERTDDYYIYLKDLRHSDAEIREMNHWGPASVVPPWIAMPSH